MRRFEWTLDDQARLSGEPGHGMDLCYLKCFFEFKRRKDRRQPLCKHRFTGSRRANEQNIVATRGCDFESALRSLLAANFGKIELIVSVCGLEFADVERCRFDPRLSTLDQVLSKQGGFTQIANRVNVYALDDRGLLRIFFRHKEVLYPVRTRGERYRQCAANRPHSPVERKFADAHSRV